MFDLYPTFKTRRFTATTATTKSTFSNNTEEAAALAAWVNDAEALRETVYNYTVTGTATEDDVFTAWRALFAYFPEKLIHTKLHAQRDDVKIFMAACGKYVKSDDGGKEWRDNTAGAFRKVVEDTIVDRIEGNKNKDLATLEKERKARTDARKARKDANVQRVATLLGVTKTEAEAIIKAQQKKNRLDKAKADYTAADKKKATQLDAAEKAKEAAATKTEEAAA